MFDEVANLTKWGRLARHQMSKVILEKKKKTIEEIKPARLTLTLKKIILWLNKNIHVSINFHKRTKSRDKNCEVKVSFAFETEFSFPLCLGGNNIHNKLENFHLASPY